MDERRQTDLVAKVLAYVGGMGAVAAGAYLVKIDQAMAGGALIALGTGWLGKLQTQPEFVKPDSAVDADRKP